MKKLSQLSMIFCAIFFFCACSEDGVDGVDGADGTNGINGEQGPQGPAGNSNVIVKQATLDNSDYSYSSFGSELLTGGYLYRFSKKATITEAAITQDIIDNGVVLVYLKTPISLGNAQYTWTPLPFSYLNSGNLYYTVWQIKIGLGYIDIHVFFETNNGGQIPEINTTNINTRTFKYVIMSGNEADAFKAGEFVVEGI